VVLFRDDVEKESQKAAVVLDENEDGPNGRSGSLFTDETASGGLACGSFAFQPATSH
jgi:hypothetical protein